MAEEDKIDIVIKKRQEELEGDEAKTRRKEIALGGIQGILRIVLLLWAALLLAMFSIQHRNLLGIIPNLFQP